MDEAPFSVFEGRDGDLLAAINRFHVKLPMRNFGLSDSVRGARTCRRRNSGSAGSRNCGGGRRSLRNNNLPPHLRGAIIAEAAIRGPRIAMDFRNFPQFKKITAEVWFMSWLRV